MTAWLCYDYCARVLSFAIYHSFTFTFPRMPHHIFGDSNVDRFLPVVKEHKTDPQIQATTFTKTTNAVLLREALTHPTVAHSVIIIAALTNLLTAKYFDDYDKLVDHCNNVFRDVLIWINEGRAALPGFASQVRFSVYPVFCHPTSFSQIICIIFYEAT